MSLEPISARRRSRKSGHRRVTLTAAALLVILSTSPAYSQSSGATVALVTYLPLIALLACVLFIPLVRAIAAAKAAPKYKTYVFVITYVEWFGWIVCLTIIGIPFGLILVLSSQAARVLLDIEANTRLAADQARQGKT